MIAVFLMFSLALGGVQAKPKAAPPRSTVQPLSAQEIAKVVEPVEEAAKLWEAVQAAEAKYKEAQNDETKGALIKAHFAFAERVMFHVNTPGSAIQLPDSKRYLTAYQSYKRVLEFEPKHADAKSRVQTIQNIYIAWGKLLS